MKVLLSSSSGTNYVPYFKFHPDAPLTNVSMPNIKWDYYSYFAQYLMFNKEHKHVVKRLIIKDIAEESWQSTRLFPHNLEILKLCDFKNNAEHCEALFNKYPDRIKMIGSGVYQITPKPVIASAL
jgi:hypothetical protein